MNTTVMTYRVSQPKMAVLCEACVDVGLEVCDTDYASDLIVCNSLVTVLDPKALRADELDDCLELIAVLEDPLQRVLVASPVRHIPDGLDQCIIVPDAWSQECLASLLDELRRDAMKRQVHVQRYREPLRRVMFIRERLNTRGHVTTAEVAKNFKVSDRTVHRDIDTLRNAGKSVIFNYSNGVYWSPGGR